MGWNEGLEIIKNQDDCFPHGKRLDYSNLTSYYYNTQDEELVTSSLISVVRGMPFFFSMGVRSVMSTFLGDFEYTDTDVYPLIDDGHTEAAVGSYFWDRHNTGNIYTLPSFNGMGGNHKTLFEDLVAKGAFSPDTNWREIPRGYVSYAGKRNIYVVTGGSWMTEELGQAICRAFGYDPIKYPWQVFVSPQVYDIEKI